MVKTISIIDKEIMKLFRFDFICYCIWLLKLFFVSVFVVVVYLKDVLRVVHADNAVGDEVGQHQPTVVRVEVFCNEKSLLTPL